MLGGLTMWIDPKSVPARVSMGTHKSSGNSNVSFRNHDCTYHFHNYHGAKVIAASRLVLDGAWYLFVDLLFLRFLRRFRVLRSELSYGAQRSSQVNKNTVQAILAPLQNTQHCLFFRDKLVESRFKNGSKSTNGVAIGKSTSGRPPRLLINLYTMRSMTESPLKLSTRKKKPPSTSTRAKV